MTAMTFVWGVHNCIETVHDALSTGNCIITIDSSSGHCCTCCLLSQTITAESVNIVGHSSLFDTALFLHDVSSARALAGWLAVCLYWMTLLLILSRTWRNTIVPVEWMLASPFQLCQVTLLATIGLCDGNAKATIVLLTGHADASTFRQQHQD